jgi:hypothetical protein
MSSHPGSTLKEAVELAEYLRELGYMPEQVQDFYPTPGTMSTCMYYTELDPRTMEKVYVPKSAHEKAMQRALIQFRKPQNYALVYEALVKARRTDLIGFGKHCLIRPRQEAQEGRGTVMGKGSRKTKGSSTVRDKTVTSGKEKASPSGKAKGVSPGKHNNSPKGRKTAGPANKNRPEKGQKRTKNKAVE